MRRIALLYSIAARTTRTINTVAKAPVALSSISAEIISFRSLDMVLPPLILFCACGLCLHVAQRRSGRPDTVRRGLSTRDCVRQWDRASRVGVHRPDLDDCAATAKLWWGDDAQSGCPQRLGCRRQLLASQYRAGFLVGATAGFSFWRGVVWPCADRLPYAGIDCAGNAADGRDDRWLNYNSR